MLSSAFSGRFVAWWFTATALAIMGVGGLLQRTPVWMAGTGRATALLAMALAYAAGGLILARLQSRRGGVTWLESGRTMMAVFGAVFVWVILTEIPFSRSTLVLAGGAAAVLTSALFFLPLRVAQAGIAIAFIVAPSAAITSHALGPVPRAVRESLVSTQLYTLRVRVHFDVAPSDSVRGGGLAVLGNRLLLATGAGDIYLVDRDGDRLKATRAALRVPLEPSGFRAVVSGSSVKAWMFRVTDVLVHDYAGDSIAIYASHHVWMPEEACFLLRVSAVTGGADALLASPPATWQTVFETSPCLPIRSQGQLFNGAQSGGRMALLGDSTLLLTVGDHEFDGVHSAQPAAQDTASAYGKTLAIDLHTGRARTFTSGHRNAQGLVVTRSGEVWLTEHGPRGGDELNRVLEGANYGWPFETYGTNYGAHFWPLATAQGRHDRYTPPVYSWLPSIGVTNVIEASPETLFALWDGDLLVASLVGQTVYRIRVQDGSVRFAEPIAIGERVRDIVQARDGAIVLWLDGGSMAVLDPAPLSSEPGAVHFAAFCGGCHMVIGGKAHGVGPDLHGVASRRVASAENFRYSDALKRLGGRWSADRLDALLREGQRLAPGMAMPDVVISDSATRAAIVRYVRALR